MRYLIVSWTRLLRSVGGGWVVRQEKVRGDYNCHSLPADVLWGSFVTHSFLPHVGEKWMRDKRTPKDVCGEATTAMVLSPSDLWFRRKHNYHSMIEWFITNVKHTQVACVAGGFCGVYFFCGSKVRVTAAWKLNRGRNRTRSGRGRGQKALLNLLLLTTKEKSTPKNPPATQANTQERANTISFYVSFHAIRAYVFMSSPLLWSPVFSRYQGSNLGKQQNLLADMSAASSSSLPPLEDRFSVILSRLDRIESSLKCLEDIKKVLVEIEGNTHPDSDGKSVYRKIVPEKVRSWVPRTIRRLTFLRAYSNWSFATSC